MIWSNYMEYMPFCIADSNDDQTDEVVEISYDYSYLFSGMFTLLCKTFSNNSLVNVRVTIEEVFQWKKYLKVVYEDT